MLTNAFLISSISFSSRLNGSTSTTSPSRLVRLMGSLFFLDLLKVRKPNSALSRVLFQNFERTFESWLMYERSNCEDAFRTRHLIHLPMDKGVFSEVFFKEAQDLTLVLTSITRGVPPRRTTLSGFFNPMQFFDLANFKIFSKPAFFSSLEPFMYLSSCSIISKLPSISWDTFTGFPGFISRKYPTLKNRRALHKSATNSGFSLLPPMSVPRRTLWVCK
mmetsp:Transcript_41056/g.103453  ORF Transcript_41056/g.103453 Transcript_41056/m.103453 type:complete len:219 (+) Transcript_41056:29-685(+)